jgi:uncharacterized Tic20 family protein
MTGDNYGRTTTGPDDSYIETEPTSDEKTWAMLAHLSGFLGYLVVIPFASIIGPLVVWLLKKDASTFVDEHGKESINFQITMSIFYAITWVLLFSIIFTLIAIPLFGLLGVWIVVLVIVAAIKAVNGEDFRYPLTIRLLR